MMQTLDYSPLVKKVILDNGMTALIFRNTAQPKVLLQVAYNIGSAVEQAGEKGLAHLLEHMIFKGTATLSEGDIDAIARKYGATYNAFTSKDATGYFFEVNKDNWQPFMPILADCMQNARFDKEHLASEMRAVLQELRMRNDNYWLLMLEKAEEAMFPAYHPYHYPIIGYKHDLATITAERLQTFYTKYYHPNRATLFVVGDINEDEIIATFTKEFGHIPQGPDHLTTPLPLIKELGSSTHHLYQAINNEQIGLFWHIPGRKDLDVVPLEIITCALTGGRSSRLFASLVHKHKVAANVVATMNHLTHGGLFCILVEPLPGKSGECLSLINKELLDIIHNGITAHDLALGTSNKLRSFINTMESPTTFCYEWLKSYFATEDEYELFNQIEHYKTITAQDIHTVIKKYLDPFLGHTVVVSPLAPDKQKYWLEIQQEEEAFEQSLLMGNVRTTPLEGVKSVKTMPEPRTLSFQFPTPDRSYTLPNGLHIVLKQLKQWPLIDLNLNFRNSDYLGASFEGTLLDLMMKLLIEQTHGYKPGEVATLFEEHGAAYNFEKTGAQLSLLTHNYTPLLKLFFKVITQPSFSHEALMKEITIHIDGYLRKKDDQSDLALRALYTMIYKKTPYAWTFDDVMKGLKALKVHDLERLHHEYINPSHFVLSVVGDFDLDEMESTLNALLTEWKDNVPHKLQTPGYVDFEHLNQDIPLLRDQTLLLLGRPSQLNFIDPDFVAVQLLNIATFLSLGSRIYQLREQTGLFYMASGSWAAQATRQQGIDMLFTILNPDNVEQAETSIRALINEVGIQGISLDELKAAQQLYIKQMIDILSNYRSVAAFLARVQTIKLDSSFYDAMLKKGQMISFEEINTIARKYFHDDALARIRVGRTPTTLNA